MTDSSTHDDELAAPRSRRSFLLGAAGVTGVAVAAGAWRGPSANAAQAGVGRLVQLPEPPDLRGVPELPESELPALPDSPSNPAAASDGRSYVSGYFALKLDDINCGIIQKFEGGDIEAAVVEVPDSSGMIVKKQIGNIKYDDFSVQLGLSMGEPVRRWIESTIEAQPLRKSGELQAADFKRDIRQVREFRDALITEVGFPAADSACKDPAYISLKFAPELTRNKTGSGKVENAADTEQNVFRPANFRLTIDGLEAASARVNKVDALTIKQTVTTDNIGEGRDYTREPGKLEFPNLRITVSEEYSHDFWAWHEDFVIAGNNDDSKEKRGSLIFLDAARQKPLLELTFSGLGIYSGGTPEQETDCDRGPYAFFEFYMEGMTARFGDPPKPK